jgi:hypothetical protein
MMKRLKKTALFSTVFGFVGGICVWFWLDRSPSSSEAGRAEAPAEVSGQTNSTEQNEADEKSVSQRHNDALLQLRASPDRIPEWSLIRQLDSPDEPRIIESFLAETNILRRRAWIWAMAAVGGSNSIQVLWRSLTNDYKGDYFSSNPPGTDEDREWLLLDTVRALGLVSQRSESALPLLIQGSNPEFWKSNITWQSVHPSASVTMFTSECIQGLGLVNHPQGIELVSAARRASATNSSGLEYERAKNFSSSYVQAAFYQSEVRRAGAVSFTESYFRGQVSDLWYDWSGTSEGSNWVAWSRQLQGLPPSTGRVHVTH